jgi:hypothetical protein
LENGQRVGNVKRILMSDHARDYYGGAMMLLIGLGAVFRGLNYNVGSLTRMGPGFFPVVLGVVLSLLGLAVIASAKPAHPRAEHAGHGPEWRGWICILLGIVAFVVLGTYGGLLPATFAIVFISALGDRENTLLSALILAVTLSILCVAIFWWALQLQFPLFAWGQ